MAKYQHFYLLLISLLFLFSCTVEKRVYNKGYHVSKNQTVKQENKRNNKEVAKHANVAIQTNAATKELLVQKQENLTSVISTTYWGKVATENCDVIYFKDGTEVKARVLEISDKAIQYKKCDTENQVVFSTSIDNILLIKYANGESFVPKQTTSTNTTPEKVVTPGSSNTQNSNYQSVAALGIVSIIMGSIAFLFMALGILVLFGLFSGWGWFLMVLAFFMAVAAIVTGIIGLVRTKKNPTKYKNPGISAAGLALGAVSILAFFAAIFILFIALSSGNSY